MAPQPEASRRDSIAAQALLSGLTELSSRASHDLLGPLNQASSLLALFIKRNSNQPDSEAGQLLEFLQHSSTRMEQIVTGLRQYMEIASRPPGFEPVDLNDSLATALAQLEAEISESSAVAESDSLPVITADAGQMVAIFEILIGNAIKFRRPDNDCRIHITSIRADEALWIAVADNGIGIRPEYRKDVFRPFLRLNGREHAGIGLGLAMAKLIAEIHGGSIRALQSKDSGTCVEFSLRAERR